MQEIHSGLVIKKMEILELTLLTNNLLDTKKFYGQIIGFDKLFETETTVSFAVGFSKLTFELTQKALQPKYHFAFNISSNKLNEAINWTLERTPLIKIENSYVADFHYWNAKSIYFYDNNQNILEFICRYDLNNSTDKTFAVETILSISEIGIVTDQLLLFGEGIIENAKVDYFSKSPKTEEFVAIGDDRGLFIISNPNRNWYPTQQLAEKWKVKGKIKAKNTVYDFEYN